MSEYQKNKAQTIVDVMDKGGVCVASVANCCEISSSTFYELGKLAVGVDEVGLIPEVLDSGRVRVRFKFTDFANFKYKWGKINELKTECGCPLMYGDFHDPDAGFYLSNGSDFITIDFELLGFCGYFD